MNTEHWINIVILVVAFPPVCFAGAWLGAKIADYLTNVGRGK